MIKIERSLIMSIAECNVSHNETEYEDNIVLNRENKCQNTSVKKHACVLLSFFHLKNLYILQLSLQNVNKCNPIQLILIVIILS